MSRPGVETLNSSNALNAGTDILREELWDNVGPKLDDRQDIIRPSAEQKWDAPVAEHDRDGL